MLESQQGIRKQWLQWKLLILSNIYGPLLPRLARYWWRVSVSPASMFLRFWWCRVLKIPFSGNWSNFLGTVGVCTMNRNQMQPLHCKRTHWFFIDISYVKLTKWLPTSERFFSLKIFFHLKHTHHIQTRPCSETKLLSLVNLVPVAIRLQNCQLRLKALITHSFETNTLHILMYIPYCI